MYNDAEIFKGLNRLLFQYDYNPERDWSIGETFKVDPRVYGETVDPVYGIVTGEVDWMTDCPGCSPVVGVCVFSPWCSYGETADVCLSNLIPVTVGEYKDFLRKLQALQSD